MNPIKVKSLNPLDLPFPILPTRGSANAAGLDLYSRENLTLWPGKRHLFKTGVVLEIPKGHEGQVRPRSGLALKHGVTLLNAPGTIDEDYTGEAMALLINHGDQPFQVTAGMRIAQVVIAPVAKFEPVWADEIKSTERGEGGFGSTGD